MLRRQCSKCKRQKAEAVMVSVKLSGEVDHEIPFTQHRKTEAVGCCQNKEMTSESTFSRLKSKSILKFGNVMKEEAFKFSQTWGCEFTCWMGFPIQYKYEVVWLADSFNDWDQQECKVWSRVNTSPLPTVYRTLLAMNTGDFYNFSFTRFTYMFP